MDIDLIDLMFTQFLSNLYGFASNDLSVVFLSMLSILFVVYAYSKISEIFNFGMTSDEIAAKNAFSDWRNSRGTWREPLMREEYKNSLRRVRNERNSRISLNSDKDET